MPGYNADSDRRNRKCIHATRVLVGYMVITGLCFAVSYFIFPQLPIHMVCDIPPHFFFLIIYLSYGVFFVSTTMAMIFSFAVPTTLMVLYYNLFVPIYKTEFKFGQRLGQRSSNQLRNLATFPYMYRSLELFISLQNDMLGWIIIPIQSLFWQIAIFVIMAVVRYWEKLEPLARVTLTLYGLVFIYIWCFALHVLGQMKVWNAKTRMSWRRMGVTILEDISRNEPKSIQARWRNVRQKSDVLYMRRFYRSCRPLYTGYKRYFITKPVSVLVFLRKISGGALKALLMTRKVRS